MEWSNEFRPTDHVYEEIIETGQRLEYVNLEVMENDYVYPVQCARIRPKKKKNVTFLIDLNRSAQVNDLTVGDTGTYLEMKPTSKIEDSFNDPRKNVWVSYQELRQLVSEMTQTVRLVDGAIFEIKKEITTLWKRMLLRESQRSKIQVAGTQTDLTWRIPRETESRNILEGNLKALLTQEDVIMILERKWFKGLFRNTILMKESRKEWENKAVFILIGEQNCKQRRTILNDFTPIFKDIEKELNPGILACATTTTRLEMDGISDKLKYNFHWLMGVQKTDNVRGIYQLMEVCRKLTDALLKKNIKIVHIAVPIEMFEMARKTLEWFTQDYEMQLLMYKY